MHEIKFFGTHGEFGFLSNFAPFDLRLEGKLWPTVEHYFQAQKFAGTAMESEIRNCATPGKAKRFGRSRAKPLRRDWEAVKDAVMRQAVLAKFRRHAQIRDLLLFTGDAFLVEHTHRDAYWGDGGDGSGRNMLGQVLMDVREQLRREHEKKED